MENQKCTEITDAVDSLTDEQFAEMVEAQCSPVAKRIAALERENARLREALRKNLRFTEAYEPRTRGAEADQWEAIRIAKELLSSA